MDIHEWQGQELLKDYAVPVPHGLVATSVDEALAAYESLGAESVVVKAQVHAGGRGTAGGIRIVDNKAALVEVVKNLLGTRLVTHQTDERGQPISSLYLVAPAKIKAELYLSAVIDRDSKKIVFLACKEGGVDIEKVAEETPEKLFRFAVDPLEGVLSYQCYQAAQKLGLQGAQVRQFTLLLRNLYALFVNEDLTLLEINPLIVNNNDELQCLDTKINIDDNALFRQQRLLQMRDPSQEDERESTAKKWDLNYIALDGNIGCMVNGAGLAMATMDSIKLAGGAPANFLDVGGGVTKERVKEAFKIILADTKVKAVLINIFGGIVQCDIIADGIVQAVSEIKTHLPVVTRLEGNNAELGKKMFLESGLNIIPADNFWRAAELVVAAASNA